MGKYIDRLLQSNMALVFSVLFLVGIGAVHLWPTSWWLQVNTFTIPTAKAGQPIEVLLDRRIKRPFFAEWSVVVQRWQGNGWVIKCEAHGSNNYRVDAVLPTPVTLDWWTGSACPTLPAGRYFVDTNWIIRGGIILPDKIVTLASNVFEIRG